MMKRILDTFDRLTQRGVRQVAHRHGRRSLVTRLGVAMVGSAVLPMLPFDRSGFGSAPKAAHTVITAKANSIGHIVLRSTGPANLVENIEPTRDRATAILRKGSDHVISEVRIRRI